MTESDAKQQGSKQQDSKHPWPGIPKPLEHRVSAKWATLEALRVLHERLRTRGLPCQVVLLTAQGFIEGTLTTISETYDESVQGESLSEIDVPSAVTHLRTDLITMYAGKDQELELVDSGALVKLTDVVMRLGARRIHLPHLAVFAAEVIAFTLVSELNM